MNKRLRFLRWLNKFLGTKSPNVNPIVNVLFYILLPCMKFYQKQSTMKYNLYEDSFIIDGRKYNRSFLNHFKKLADNGDTIKFIDNGDEYLFEIVKRGKKL